MNTTTKNKTTPEKREARSEKRHAAGLGFWRVAASAALWAVKVPASLVFAFISLFLAPVVVLFAKDDANGLGWLPRWLWWFQTPDNPVDGEPFWRDAHPNRYIRRVGWLWRNAGYGFDWMLSPVLRHFVIFKTGNQAVSNTPLVEGCFWRYARARYHGATHDAWQLYIVKAWPFGIKKCVRINLGYKLFNAASGKVAQLVFSPSPCMGCTIKP
jgi:hypothetical protein